jgi:hypothetical protein
MGSWCAQVLVASNNVIVSGSLAAPLLYQAARFTCCPSSAVPAGRGSGSSERSSIETGCAWPEWAPLTRNGGTELQLPRKLFPKILKYREQILAEAQAELERLETESTTTTPVSHPTPGLLVEPARHRAILLNVGGAHETRDGSPRPLPTPCSSSDS